MEERVMIINLRKALEKPVTKVGRAAVAMLRDQVARHTKSAESAVKLDGDLIEILFQHGGKKPLKRIKVKIVKDEKGGVIALPPEKEFKRAPPKAEKKEEKKKEPKQEAKTEVKAAEEKKEEQQKQPKPKFEQKQVEAGSK